MKHLFGPVAQAEVIHPPNSSAIENCFFADAAKKYFKNPVGVENNYTLKCYF